MTIEEYIAIGCPAIADIYPHLSPAELAREVDRLRPWRVMRGDHCLDSFATEAGAREAAEDLAADGRYGAPEEITVSHVLGATP